jgi:tetratricopeptide (TPR) repeat protein
MPHDIVDDVIEVGPHADDLPPPPTQRLTIGGYDILEEIGSGGMGVVYRARHRQLGRTVALKLLRAGALAGHAERQRFLREARVGAGLQHPSIVQVFEVGEYEGCPYLALEYVPNETLARRLVAGPLPPREAATLLETLARAVHYAHERGVIHRDLKPANILLRKDEGGRLNDEAAARLDLSFILHPSSLVPKIADFGLARLMAEGGTDPGTVMGTPAYMAPEQAAGRAAEAGPGADVYALGAILYECVTGRPPFQAPTHVETLRRVLSDEPVRASKVRAAVPRDLDTICMTCLAKEPARRYASAAELADDLRRFLDGRPILARPIGPWGRTTRWVRRNPRVAALLVLLAGALVGVAFEWRRSEHLFEVANNQRLAADGLRAAAEANLARYRQAADDFAGLLDQLDTDQLFHLRWAPLRAELIIPALRRNQEFLEQYANAGDRRAEIVQTHFRVAILTRLLSIDGEPQARKAALDAGRLALDKLEAFAGDQATIVQYRRDRAALTHNLGFLLHATQQSAEALPVMETACRLRQEILDGEPENIDYRSELAGCWNDRGLVLYRLKRYEEAVAAHDRAIQLQVTAVGAAPQVQRYRQFLCNHHYNRAADLRELGRTDESIAAAEEACRLMPRDPEQEYRKARILASLSRPWESRDYTVPAIASIRRAIGLGLLNTATLIGHEDFNSIRQRPGFVALAKDLESKRASQPPR